MLSTKSSKGKKYRSQRAVRNKHVPSHIPSQWTLAKTALLCLGTTFLATLMLSPIIMIEFPEENQRPTHVGLGSLIKTSKSLRQNWKSFIEREENYIKAALEKDFSSIFNRHEQLAPKETLPHSQADNLGRGVAGLPLQQTPALHGASRGTLICESDTTADTRMEKMVYWNQPQGLRDREFQTAFRASEEKFLTFEPDCGGWNNIRMR